jgi:hypothetical protein
MAAAYATENLSSSGYCVSDALVRNAFQLEKISCSDTTNQWLDVPSLVGRYVLFEQHFPSHGDFESQTIQFSALVTGFSAGLGHDSIPSQLFLYHPESHAVDPAHISTLTVLSLIDDHGI